MCIQSTGSSICHINLTGTCVDTSTQIHINISKTHTHTFKCPYIQSLTGVNPNTQD